MGRHRSAWPLVALAALAASPARAEWREASTVHFVVYSEQNARSLEEFATKLERYDKAIRVLRGLPDEQVGQAGRVTVYVVSSVQAVRKLFGQNGATGVYGVAGFYVPRAGGSIAIVPRPGGPEGALDLGAETILFHEYAHHFMMRNYPVAFPAWFIEGFAEFHSTAKFEKDGRVGIGATAMHRAAGLVLGPRLKVEKLVTMGSERMSAEEREAMYGYGWLLTHYLSLADARKGQLGDYLRRINNGQSSLDAARAAFGDLAKLDKELASYMGKRLYYWQLPANLVPPVKVSMRTLSPGEDAVMDIKIRSRRGVNEEQAKELLPLVRKAAAPFPNDAAAQMTLAEAEYDAGNYKEAEAAADRAIAADPKAIDGHVYKGRARIALALAAKSEDPAVWKEARRPILAANKLDPDDPEPLILFYNSIMAERGEATPNAALGLFRAMELAPEDKGLRWSVAFQHLVDGKGPEARAALLPLAYDPHGGEGAARAAQLIEKIDKEGPAAALALSAENPEDAKAAGGGAEPGD